MTHHRKAAQEVAARTAVALEGLADARLREYREKVRGMRERFEAERLKWLEEVADFEALLNAQQQLADARALEAAEAAGLLEAALARIAELEAALDAAVVVKEIAVADPVPLLEDKGAEDPDTKPAPGRKAKGGDK